MVLYSYCIPFDNGAAPNPFWNVCTLAICKPVIRRTANIGDWIVGTGSKKVGFDNKVIYAMKVTDKKTMQEYDDYCNTYLPEKIPDSKNIDFRRKLGDCIYDYSNELTPVLRKGVHSKLNRARDLCGKYVLLSDHYYYFGSRPVPLPSGLLKIVNQRQGHKGPSNEPYKEYFVEWMATFNTTGIQSSDVIRDMEASCIDCDFSQCSIKHKQSDDEDENNELYEYIK